MDLYGRIIRKIGIEGNELAFSGDIYKQTSKMGIRNRRQIVKMIDDAVYGEHVAGDTRKRMVLCRILVALIPESLVFISEALDRRDSCYDYEMHFTLFCYLDDVQDIKEIVSYEDHVVQMAHRYLMSVKKETASSAWMAGDFVGDHWRDVDVAEGILMDVLKNGRYVAGRFGAACGLGKLIQRVPRQRKKKIRKEANSVMKCDRSTRIREFLL